MEGDDYFPIARDSLTCLHNAAACAISSSRKIKAKAAAFCARGETANKTPPMAAEEWVGGMEGMEGCNAPLILNFAVVEHREGKSE